MGLEVMVAVRDRVFVRVRDRIESGRCLHPYPPPTHPNRSNTHTPYTYSYTYTYPRGVRELEDVDGRVGCGLLLEEVRGAPGGAAEHVVVEDVGEHGAVVDPRGVLPRLFLLRLLVVVLVCLLLGGLGGLWVV